MNLNKKLAGFASIILISFIILTSQQTDLVELINKELAGAPSAAGQPAFGLLDAAQFTDAMYPWLGFPVTVLSEKMLLGEESNVSNPPDEIRIEQVLLRYKDKKRLILHLDSWSIENDKPENVLTEAHVKWYLQVIKLVKEVLPGVDVGILGIPYSPWNALNSNATNLAEYQRVYQLLRPVITASDTLYPMFQVPSYKINDLAYLMGVQLYIAKATGKPVYPVLSHRQTIKGDWINEIIPFELTRQQCEFVRNNADGMVWWTGKEEEWDNRWYEKVSKQCFFH